MELDHLIDRLLLEFPQRLGLFRRRRRPGPAPGSTAAAAETGPERTVDRGTIVRRRRPARVSITGNAITAANTHTNTRPRDRARQDAVHRQPPQRPPRPFHGRRPAHVPCRPVKAKAPASELPSPAPGPLAAWSAPWVMPSARSSVPLPWSPRSLSGTCGDDPPKRQPVSARRHTPRVSTSTQTTSAPTTLAGPSWRQHPRVSAHASNPPRIPKASGITTDSTGAGRPKRTRQRHRLSPAGARGSSRALNTEPHETSVGLHGLHGPLGSSSNMPTAPSDQLDGGRVDAGDVVGHARVVIRNVLC